MKANELKLGNYVFDYRKELITIRAILNPRVIMGYFVECEENGSRYEFSDIKPIPLTEEWLLKLGFKKKKFDYVLCSADVIEDDYKIEVCLTEKKDKFYLKLGDGEDKQFFGYYKYVHQLQNLYFALTGEELCKI